MREWRGRPGRMSLSACTLLFALGGSAWAAGLPLVEPTPQAAARTPVFSATKAGAVSLSRSTQTLREYAYTLDEDGLIEDPDAARTSSAIRARNFEAWVIENDFVRATLVPGYGGRILSLIYKPTGHESFYRNPVASAYGIGDGNFLYDWLQVWGGVFPTFGPEHGKAWNHAWAFEVLRQDAEAVSVVMRWKDDREVFTPPSFRRYGRKTGLELAYTVTLRAGRAALDTRIEIHNPTPASQDYEYWTNVSLAPGSDAAHPAATAGAEVVYPLQFVTAAWCPNESRCRQTLAQARPADAAPGQAQAWDFGALRQYRNWPEWGIFYAWPDMANRNFWGVINHDNDEGLIRIADNQLTRGLKFWTFGYPSSKDIDPEKTRSPYRPFIELWAGATREFFRTRNLAAGATDSQAEVYAPTQGLKTVSHANDNFVADLRVSEGALRADIVCLYPDAPLGYRVRAGDKVLAGGALAAAVNGVRHLVLPLDAGLAAGANLTLELMQDTGQEAGQDSVPVFEASLPR
ncbi:DUF5107 domain-containing protein [Niveibacterium sp. SC-1]|uniref:DUF5107 domain-containing protein n=1 Tax=Niveibacterium sp. SC-1 TaxID=3135646 RepID=UPI00311FC140